MAFERITDNYKRLKESFRAFAQSSAEYHKLNLYNLTMKGATAAVKYLAVVFFVLFAVLFLSIAAAVALSTWIEVPSSGFLIVGGIYLLIGLIILFFGGGPINKMMLSKTSKKVFKDDEKQPKKAHPEYAKGVKYKHEEVIIEEDKKV